MEEKIYSDDIGMEFRIEKCAMQIKRKGNRQGIMKEL